MSAKEKRAPESIVREIKRKTRRKFTTEEKIRIVLEGLQGESSIADLCRREGIHTCGSPKYHRQLKCRHPDLQSRQILPLG